MSCNCQYELVYKTRNGSIHQSTCGIIYLEYGNISMTFKNEGYYEFAHFIDEFDLDNAHHFLRPPNNKVLIQPSKKSPNAYALLLPEIEELKNLLHHATNIISCLNEVQLILK